MNILIISGSPMTKSRSSTLLDYTQRWFKEYNAVTERVSVRDFDANVLLNLEYKHSQIQDFIQKIKGADGIIIASPVYQSSYAGILKAVLDLLPQRSFISKPVLPIMTGGADNHQLALDYAFKPLLATLKAEEIMGGVYASDNDFKHSKDTNEYIISDKIIERLNNNLQIFYQSINRNKKHYPNLVFHVNPQSIVELR